MLYHSHALRHFITWQEDRNHMADVLTRKVCEVEEVVTHTIPPKVIVAKITTVTPHPDADKLVVCQIDGGQQHGQLTICTAATNTRDNQYVPVAVPGSYLPAIDLSIGERKMRGILSQGMICAKEELGFMEDLEGKGIRDLADDFDDLSDEMIGRDLVDVFPWMERTILDIENKTITHRPDLTGHLGLALECDTLASRGDLTPRFHAIRDRRATATTSTIRQMLDHATRSDRQIDIQTDGCMSYLAIELDEMTVSDSSFLTRMLIRDCGLQPRNNRVDRSQMVMMLTGQPIHVFDADTIEGSVIVRDARDGEVFVSLTGQEHELTADDIVIADESKILALAGVMGSETSAVSDSTTRAMVEIATFDPVRVRKTALRLNLRTDASMRFEKHLNPAMPFVMLTAITDTMKRYAADLGSFEIGGMTRYGDDALTNHASIDYDHERLQTIVGMDIDRAAVDEILTTLGFTVTEQSVTAPLWRAPNDVMIFADIVEEVARMIGFDAITPRQRPRNRPAALSSDVQLTRDLEDALVKDCGVTMLETYPRAHSDDCAIEDGDQPLPRVTLHNPIGNEYRTLRRDLCFPLLRTVAKNQGFFRDIHIASIGPVRHPEQAVTASTSADSATPSFGPHAHEHDIVGIMRASVRDASSSRQDHPFVQLQADIDIVIRRMLNQSVRFVSREGEALPATHHPRQTVRIVVGETEIGEIYTIHPLAIDHLKTGDGRVCAYAFVDLDRLEDLRQGLGDTEQTYTTLQDQIVTRDVSFMATDDLSFAPVQETLRRVEGVTDVQIFDVYQGEYLPAGHKSVSVSLTITGDGGWSTDRINDVLFAAVEQAKTHGRDVRDR